MAMTTSRPTDHSAGDTPVPEPKDLRTFLAALTAHDPEQLVVVDREVDPVFEATAIVETFLTTPWSDEPRHQRRIDLLLDYERTGEI